MARIHKAIAQARVEKADALEAIIHREQAH